MKKIRFIGVLVGGTLVGYLLHRVGWASVRETLGLLGWRYAIVLAYPLTWIVLNTTGWAYACHRGTLKISLIRLMQIRLAGETFNSLLPSGYVGGEPLKAKLLSATMPLREATSSVLIAKAAQSIGLVFFVALGLSVGHPDGGSPWRRAETFTAVGFLSVGIGIFTWLLANRSFSQFGRFLHRWTGHSWLQAQEPRLVALDDSLGSFYREGKGRFAASIAWHGAGWVAGALEVCVISHLIGQPLDWRQSWFMGAMAQLAAVVGLISPGGVGFYEGGHYLAAQLLGLPPSLGVSISLIRRVRELFWDAVGVFLLWKLGAKPPRPENA